MIKSKNKRKIQTFLLLTLLVGTIITNISFLNAPFTTDISSLTENKNDNVIDVRTELTKTSQTYSNNVSDTGNDFDIALHQAKVDGGTGVPLYRISNASDPTNTTFSTTCPTESTFSSTRSQIFVEDIYAPDKTLELEDGIGDDQWVSAAQRAFSFYCPGNGIFENLTLYFSNRDTDPGDVAQINIDLMSATVTGIPSNTVIQNLVLLYDVENNTADYHTWTNLGKSFQASQTQNNKWFIRVIQLGGGSGELYMHGTDDGAGEPDDSDAYHNPTGWNNPDAIDYYADIGLSPTANTPTPDQINLQLNNTDIIGDNPGYGNVTIPNDLSSLPNKLNYTITADWWDVSCNITKIQVNYTKSDLKATSRFTAIKDDPKIYWNVTRSGLNYFQAGFENFQINFTIPSRWEKIQIWNGGLNKTDNINIIRDRGDGYQDVQVFGAENGNYWYLNATSDNLLQSVITEDDIILFKEEVQINATFSVNIGQNDGELNTTIYNYMYPNTLNHSDYKTSFNGGSELNFTKWDVSDTVVEYGIFLIQALWKNATDVGFGEGNLTIIGETSLESIAPEPNAEYPNNRLFNLTLYYNDTGGHLTPSGITDASIINKTDGQEITDPMILKTNGTDGYYFIEINTTHYAYGYNTIELFANKTFHQNHSIDYTFMKIINTTITSDNESTNLGDIFRGDIVRYSFNYTTAPNLPPLDANKSIVNAQSEVIINNGNFDPTFQEIGDPGHYQWVLDSTYVSAQEIPYNFVFNISAIGNETQEIALTIRVLLPKTIVDYPDYSDLQVPVGKNITVQFNFTDAYHNKRIESITSENISVEYYTGVVWNDYNVTYGGDPNFTNGAWELYNLTGGEYILNITTWQLTGGNRYTIRIIISYSSPNPGPYNESLIEITNFLYGTAAPSPSPPPDGGDDDSGDDGGTTVMMGIDPLWIIIIAIIGGLALTSFTVYKKVVVPKKREKERILREVTTVFDDAINVEHILVIYKGTGTCLFFKSYGMEEIDPELISGFLTAVSSFGREMDSQEALNEIQYGDKMLLLADGDYVRVALVLDKQASIFLRQNLKEFIEDYEIRYRDALPEWRGRLDVFRDSGDLVDEKLQTSIILPHEIIYDLGKVKSLKVSHSRDVLKVAQQLIEGSERKFFFIATLLSEAIRKIGKDKTEVFMGIKELREIKLLAPIQISAIEAPPISQQELNMLRQQVCVLPGLSEEEIDKIVYDLAQMSPPEREAYLASCQEQAEIVSAPIVSKAGTKVINTLKSAKKEINNLKKNAKTQIKQKDLKAAIETYTNAAVIATNWDMRKEVEQLEDTIRITKINRLKEMKKTAEIEAKKAVKKKDYATATEKYRQASQMASEIFKLGEDIGPEQKRLTTLSKKYEKLI